MEFLAEYGLFLAKVVTFVVASVFIIGLIVSSKHKEAEKGHIRVTKLNDLYEEFTDTLKQEVFDSATLKQEHKQKKKQEKEQAKALKKTAKQDKGTEPPIKKRVFVLDFNGDIKASACDNLREEITALLGVASANDEVVVKLESGGGMVHSYGLAASQLTRITDKGIPLTVCVDKVAASGGYMMACVANKILAAPFAILGSIGVVAQLPNFHRLLKKNDIDYELFTAGEYKRTVTMLGENTKKGREKFLEDIEHTHELFKDFVSEHRSVVDMTKVATGEVWYGRKALEVKLIDEIATSDAYLLAQHPEADILSIEFHHKKTLSEKLGFAAEAATDRLLVKWWQRAQARQWF
ncbi:MAG TPA: protease SohB [Cellvibrionaceae bacterium]